MQAACGKIKLLDLAKETIRIAAEGLERIAPDEAKYLEALWQRVLVEEKSPADVLLENWNNSIENVFKLTAI